jgi:hypothetical protein
MALECPISYPFGEEKAGVRDVLVAKKRVMLTLQIPQLQGAILNFIRFGLQYLSGFFVIGNIFVQSQSPCLGPAGRSPWAIFFLSSLALRLAKWEQDHGLLDR